MTLPLELVVQSTVLLSLSCPGPCRYPFLLVDRVIEWEQGKFAVGYKNVTSNDQFFNGHFPERAIMPGKIYDVSGIPAAARACPLDDS